MTLEEYFGDWIKVIDKKEVNEAMKVVVAESKTKVILPAIPNIFRAFQLCPYNNLKMVFIGQDPYPQRGVATGILFGNKSDVSEENLSPSLKVIKEAAIDYEKPHYGLRFDNTLESWAKQGILMINSSLTVEMGRVGSHTMLWRPFITSLLTKISEYNTGIIYVLFGSQAQTLKPYISKFNDVVCIEHPAYFARLNKRMPSSLFTKINEMLKYKDGTTIKWYEELE